MKLSTAESMSEMCAGLPGRIDAMALRCSEFRAEFYSCQREIEQQIETCRADIAEVGHLCETLSGTIRRGSDGLQVESEKVSGIGQTLIKEAVGRREIVLSQSQKLQAAFEKLREVSMEAHAAANDADEKLAAKASALITEDEQGVDQLKGILSAYDTALSGLEGFIPELSRYTEEMVNSLQDSTEVQNTDLVSTFSDLQQSLEDGSEAFQGAADELKSEVLHRVASNLEETTRKLVDQHLSEVIQKVEDEIRSVVDRVRGNLRDSEDEISRLKVALKPLIDQVEEMLQPLHAAIDNVRSVGSKVGISF